MIMSAASSSEGPVCVGTSSEIFSLTSRHPSYTSAVYNEPSPRQPPVQTEPPNHAHTPLVQVEQEQSVEAPEVEPATSSSRSQCNITEYKHILGRLNLQDEAHRRRTFGYWPNMNAPIDKDGMARSGLYFSGVGDMVECYACSVLLGNWELNQNPMERHHATSPQCRHLRMMDPAELRASRSDRVHQASNTPTAEVYRNPYSPLMQDYQRRLNSYVAFRPNCRLHYSTERFCEAGFFATGHGDKVTCWCCGKSLSNFLATDDPWVEHARWSPSCQFLQAKKGSRFVDEIQLHSQPRPTTRQASPRFSTVESGPSRIPSPVNADPPNQSARDELLATALEQENAMRAIEIFGFEPVRRVTESKIRRDNCYYHSTEALCDAVIEEYQRPSRTQPDRVVPRGQTTTTSPQPAVASQQRMDELERRSRCKVCLTSEANVVLLDCRHLCACARCADMLTTCPLCRAPIGGRMSVFV